MDVLDISLTPREQMVECQAVRPRLEVDTNAINDEVLSHNHVDDVPILDATEPEHVLQPAVDRLSNDIPNPNTASHEIMPDDVPISDTTNPLHWAVGRQSNDIPNPNTPSPEIVLQQEDLDIVGDGSRTESGPHHMEGLQMDDVVAGRPSDDGSVPNVAGTKPGLHQAARQHLEGDVSDADGAQAAPPRSYFSFSSPLDISGQYTRPNQKLIFLLSTVVAFIAIVIQYELGPEMLHRSAGRIRPGWARHRNEGWKRKELARQ